MAWDSDTTSSTDDQLEPKSSDDYFAKPRLPIGKQSIDPTRKVKIGGPPKKSTGLGKRKSTTKPRGIGTGKQTTKSNEWKGA